MHSPYRLNKSLVALAFFSLLVGHPAPVGAYKQLPIGSNFQPKEGRPPTGIRNYRTRKNNVLKGTEPLSQYGGEMLAYYKQYALPALTRDDQRENWDDLRKEIVSDLMIAKPQPRLEVLKLVWKYCNGIVPNDQFHPSVRYNFLLLLGDLNQTEASGNAPPVPLSKPALPKLMEPFENEAYPPMLRYAAIIGLIRHAELTGHPASAAPMNAAHKEKLAQLMTKVAADPKAPAGVDESAHNWLRAKAVETLGDLYLGSEEVVTTLANLLTDENAGLDVRCEAARALGKISAQIDRGRAEDLIGRLTKLANDCAQTEFGILRRQRSTRGGREGESSPRWERDPSSQDSGRAPVEIADPRTTPTRRRLLFQLLAVQEGLVGNGQDIAGLIKLADAADHVEPLKSELTKLINALQDVELQYEKLGAFIQKAANEELPAMVPEKLKRTADGKEKRPKPNGDMAATP